MTATALQTTPPATILEGYEEWMFDHDLGNRTIGYRTQFARARLREWGTFEKSPAELARWTRNYDGWSRSTYVGHLRSLYAYLIEAGHIEGENPTRLLRRGPAPAPRSEPLKDDERDLVLEQSAGDVRLWVMLGLYAGLRCHEIAKFRGSDINELQLTVLGKGGKAARLPTHPALWRMAQERPDDDYWFPSPVEGRTHIAPNTVNNGIKNHFAACGITRGSTHRLRHTYANQLRRNGVDLSVIQSLMRHSSLATTQRYFAVDSSELRSAIDALAGPLGAGV